MTTAATEITIHYVVSGGRMRKIKWALTIPITILLGLVTIYIIKTKNKTNQVQTQPKSPITTINNSNNTETSPDIERKPIQTLKGVDFLIETYDNGNDQDKDISITFDDGKTIAQYFDINDKKYQIGQILFNKNDQFELKKILPDAPREQLIITGSNFLHEGMGTVDVYQIFIIEKNAMVNILNLLTERNRDKVEMYQLPPQKLKATVQLEVENGQPLIKYQYSLEDSPLQTILFKWNGKKFVDTSGKYKEIENEYTP